MDSKLTTKLTMWQQEMARSGDPAALAEATYDVVETIADYRFQLEIDKTTTAADRTILLDLLDDLLIGIGSQLQALRG